MINEISLYIHIPFCKSKCNYCDFLSFSCNNIKEQKLYVDVLCNEIMEYKELSKNYIVSSIFIGGGTPSILDETYIELIMLTINQVWDVKVNAEITIESNPDSLTYKKLLAYKKVGINRLSIGLQSANDEELRVLGRPHNYDQFTAAFNSGRAAGFDNINIDVMSALPNQSFGSYGTTLAKVLAHRPEHISSYSLIIEEGTPFYEDDNIIDSLPDEDTDRKMYSQTKRLLKASGYSRYEISNYAKKGYECRHNIVYWTGGQYLGLGLGASSYVDGVRFKNGDDLQEYIKYGAVSIREEGKRLTIEEKMEEYMFLGLRLMKGISIERFNKLFDEDIYNIYGDIIHKYEEIGLLIIDEDNIRFSDSGIDVSNQILSAFII